MKLTEGGSNLGMTAAAGFLICEETADAIATRAADVQGQTIKGNWQRERGAWSATATLGFGSRYLAGEDARTKLGQLRMPLLAMHGENDTLTFPSGTRALYEAASSADKTLKLWPGMKHEIFNEPDRREVITFMLDWIDARIPGKETANE